MEEENRGKPTNLGSPAKWPSKRGCGSGDVLHLCCISVYWITFLNFC